jgi:hypothetical protein
MKNRQTMSDQGSLQHLFLPHYARALAQAVAALPQVMVEEAAEDTGTAHPAGKGGATEPSTLPCARCWGRPMPTWAAGKRANAGSGGITAGSLRETIIHQQQKWAAEATGL